MLDISLEQVIVQNTKNWSDIMAGNFWQSSHSAQWILDKTDLLRERQPNLQALTEDEYQQIIIFFSNFIQVQNQPFFDL